MTKVPLGDGARCNMTVLCDAAYGTAACDAFPRPPTANRLISPPRGEIPHGLAAACCGDMRPTARHHAAAA